MDNENFFIKLFQLDKTPVKFYSVLSLLGCIIFIFEPKAIVEAEDFKNWQGIILFVFLTSVAFLVVSVVSWLLKLIYKKYQDKNLARSYEKKWFTIFNELNKNQRLYIQEFLVRNTTSINFASDNADLERLVKKNILSEYYIGGTTSSFSLNHEVREILIKHNIDITSATNLK